MNLTKKSEMNLFRRALAVLLTTLLTLNPVSPIFTPKEVNAQENSNVKFLSEVDLSGATIGSSWENKYDTTFYDTINSNYSSGYGSEGTALQISTDAQLAAFAKAVNEGKDFSKKYVKLTADINLQGTNLTVTNIDDGTDSNGNAKFKVVVSGEAQNAWVPIGNVTTKFKGNFDGDGHEVSNMTVLANSTSSSVYAGLFGYTESCTIQNTGVTGNVYASSSSYVYAGGLVGYRDSSVSSSSSSISNSYATGSVYAFSSSNVVYAGGLAGSNKFYSVSNSYATGSVYASSYGYCYAGGLVGNSSSISNSYATGSVYASSSSSSDGVRAGGLVGYNSTTGSSVSNSYATGSVYASSSSSSDGVLAGGLVGSNWGANSSVSNSYATGSVYASSSSSSNNEVGVGGLVGYNTSTIRNSYATGSVYAFSSSNVVYAGGLVGYNGFYSVSNSYATGSVYASSSSSDGVRAGGLIGYNKNSSISNSYATGSVYASSPSSVYAGGLVGINYNDNDNVTNSYYNSEATIEGVETPADIGIGLTREQMTGITGGVDGRAKDKMEGFDEEKWTFTKDEGRVRYFPRLRCFEPAETDENLGGCFKYTETDGANPAPYYEVGLTAADFDFAKPSDLTYDGTPKEATVTSNKEGMGDITVYYQTMELSDGELVLGDLTSEPPTDAGAYKVKIDVADNGENYNNKDNITADDWTFTIEQATPTASDFDFAKPSDLTYDGTEKVAKITTKDGITGMGDITVKYCKEGSDSGTDTAPTDAGTYSVKIDVAEGENYNAEENITAKDWKFTIEQATPTASDFYLANTSDLTYDGNEKEATVTSNKEGMGEITVNYYDLSGNKLDTAPTDVGTYKVKIDVAEGTNYKSATDIGGWTFTIKKAEHTNPRTPGTVSIIYGTKLSDVNLSDGWEWDDGSIVPTIENEGYKVFYQIEDDINYDWSNIDGYNPETHRVERKIAVEVSVDKSTWGEKVENSGLINYVDEDGTTSAEVTDRGMIWIKESSEGTSAWYAIDNSKGTFKLGSRFRVKWLSKNSDPQEWQQYYDNLDEVHKNVVESDRLWIFLAEIIDPDGVKYTNLDSEVPFYVELGEDWDKDDINAVFISQAADEVVDVEYVNDINCPERNKEFAKLTLKHFSPYAVYDRLENQEALPSDIENKDDLKYNFYLEDEDKGLPALFNWFTTGDTNTLIIVTGLAVLVIASGVVILLLKKKRKR